MIKEITVGAGHTIPTAPYENLKVEASITVLINADVDNNEVLDTVQKLLRSILVQTIAAQRRDNK